MKISVRCVYIKQLRYRAAYLIKCVIGGILEGFSFWFTYLSKSSAKKKTVGRWTQFLFTYKLARLCIQERAYFIDFSAIICINKPYVIRWEKSQFRARPSRFTPIITDCFFVILSTAQHCKDVLIRTHPLTYLLRYVLLLKRSLFELVRFFQWAQYLYLDILYEVESFNNFFVPPRYLKEGPFNSKLMAQLRRNNIS